MEYNYDQLFSRNIGIFTPEEQDKIKNLKIAILGVGGLGAPATECLARLGVGELRLVEPDCYDISNINRQTGAYIDTVDKNKAEVMAIFAKKINPKIKLIVKTNKIHDDELEELVRGCNIIIDAIDFFNIEDAIELHEIAKKYNIPIVSEQSCVNITSFTVFYPNEKMLSDLIIKGNRKDMIREVVKLTLPVLPKGVSEDDVENLLNSIDSNSKNIAIPSYSVLVPLSGAIISQIIINLLIKSDRKKYIPIMPSIMYFDNIQFGITKIIR